jgi:DnaJ-class molecular chaperone
MNRNHYETLGLSKESSESEIKKAYRGLSLKYHPDRNNAVEAKSKFQEINEAYEILSDASKKREYDDELNGIHRNPFMNMARGADGSVEVEVENIGQFFNMMFGGGMPGMGPGMGHGMGPGMGPGVHIFHGAGMPFFHPHALQKPPPIIKNIHISFEQAFLGCSVAIDIEKWTVINGMKVHETQTIHINIMAGVSDGETIVLRDCGNQLNDDLKGDVKIVVGVSSHPQFQRHGMDLLYKKTIGLKEALTGFSFDIKHLSGKILCLNNSTNRTIIRPHYKKVISGLGMQKEGVSGNLIIEFDIEFPESLTEAQMNTIASTL